MFQIHGQGSRHEGLVSVSLFGEQKAAGAYVFRAVGAGFHGNGFRHSPPLVDADPGQKLNRGLSFARELNPQVRLVYYGGSVFCCYYFYYGG